MLPALPDRGVPLPPFRDLSAGQNQIHDFDTEKNSRASLYKKAELEVFVDDSEEDRH